MDATEIIKVSEVSQKEKEIRYHLYTESNIQHKWTYEADSQRTDLWVPRGGEGEGDAWTVGLGLVDAKYYTGMDKQDPTV